MIRRFCAYFVHMIDNSQIVKHHANINSQIVKHHANILLLGDFNVDLLKPHSSYYYTARQDSFLTATCEITYLNYTAVCYSYRSHIHKQLRRYHRGQNTWPEHKLTIVLSVVWIRLSFQNVHLKPIYIYIYIYHFGRLNILMHFSDHCPICCLKLIKPPKCMPKTHS